METRAEHLLASQHPLRVSQPSIRHLQRLQGARSMHAWPLAGRMAARRRGRGATCLGPSFRVHPVRGWPFHPDPLADPSASHAMQGLRLLCHDAVEGRALRRRRYIRTVPFRSPPSPRPCAAWRCIACRTQAHRTAVRLLNSVQQRVPGHIASCGLLDIPGRRGGLLPCSPVVLLICRGSEELLLPFDAPHYHVQGRWKQ